MQGITVIIPVYNVELYLRACLDSVVNQTYIAKEVLLVNDGSTDLSGAICEEYAARYQFIRVIHKVNGGLSSARNRGLEEARGQWVIFLDSDDVWNDNECLAKLHSYAITLNLDVVRFEYLEVDEKLEPIASKIYNKSRVEGCVVDNYSLVRYGIAGEWFAVLYFLRMDAIADLRFNERTRFQEDIDFYCRFFARRELRCGYLNEKMYLYRKRTASITSTYKIQNLKGSFDLCDVFYGASQNIKNVNLKKLYLFYSVMMYYWTLQTLASDLYYDRREPIIEELQLNVIHDKVMSRIRESEVSWKYRIFITPSPSKGVKILHLKDKIRAFIL